MRLQKALRKVQRQRKFTVHRETQELQSMQNA